LALFDFLKKKAQSPQGGEAAAKQPSHPMLELALEQLEIQDDDVVLHVGFGMDLEPMMRMVPLLDRGRLAGIESSFPARERAVRVFDEEFKNFKADFRDAVVSKIPFYDGSFTKVLSMGQMQDWINPDKAFDEISRVLAPGGVFVLAWNPPSSKPSLLPEPVGALLKSAGFYHPQLRERGDGDSRHFLFSAKKL
jgi:SAM-dependent methyltransferase